MLEFTGMPYDKTTVILQSILPITVLETLTVPEHLGTVVIAPTPVNDLIAPDNTTAHLEQLSEIMVAAHCLQTESLLVPLTKLQVENDKVQHFIPNQRL